VTVISGHSTIAYGTPGTGISDDPEARVEESNPDDTDTGLVAIDTSVASEARVYDYLLGGVNNFEIDRQVAHRQGAATGGIEYAQAGVRMNRVFLGQAVRYLAGEAGIRQFLDIGTGIPTMGNVHEVAQQVAPTSRIVCADYDPVVLAHAHTLMRSTSEGAAAYIQGDFRDPDAILRKAADTLDFSQPVAVMLIALLHFFPDESDPQGLVARLMAVVPPGSYLAISHMTADLEPEKMGALAEAPGDQAQYVFVMRTKAEVARFFEGYEMAGPGLSPLEDWLPDDQPAAFPETARMHWCGVGRKP
jgi:S-adenosyl methyltransferase